MKKTLYALLLLATCAATSSLNAFDFSSKFALPAWIQPAWRQNGNWKKFVPTSASINARYKEATCPDGQKAFKAVYGKVCESISQHPIASEFAILGIVFACVAFSNSPEPSSRELTTDEFYDAMDLYATNERQKVLVKEFRAESKSKKK